MDKMAPGRISVGNSIFVRLGKVRLGKVRLGKVRFGKVRLGQVRFWLSSKYKDC